MAHVLIDGESRQMQEVHSLLRRWGLTVGRLPVSAGARGRASRAECDLVVFLCDEEHDAREPHDTYLKSVSAPVDPLPAEPESAAPLLVIGRGPLARIMGRQARRRLAGPGPDGADLHEALQDCLSGGSTGVPGAGCRDRDQQFHFLGHELRSPLTAIKTALEVMQGDAWNPSCGCSAPVEAPPVDDSRLRMLEIALRNVRRMHYAVDWSQNLMKFEDARPAVRSRTVDLEGLSGELAAADPADVDVSPARGSVECDADLFLHVARQALQAARCDDPERPVALALRIESGEVGRLRLDIAREATDDDREMIQHLQRFADFLNPTRALRGAGCGIALHRDPDGPVGLSVTISCSEIRESRLTLVG